MDADGLGVSQPYANLFSEFFIKFISYQKICHRTEYIYIYIYIYIFVLWKLIHSNTEHVFLRTSATYLGYINVAIIRLRRTIQRKFFT